MSSGKGCPYKGKEICMRTEVIYMTFGKENRFMCENCPVKVRKVTLEAFFR